MQERWRKVREIFMTVCDAAPERQAGLLAQLCADDQTLRHEVESLLQASRAAPTLLDQPPTGRIHDLLPTAAGDTLVGQRIGPYRLASLIASGGMGSVYLAERADEQFRKTVAIKLIRHGMIDELSLQRFRNERQTLANLDHPYIARLVDGGVTSGALPYLVMEYVEGKPIDVYCDERRLNTTARLELFLYVCAAVQYAHQNLVVHRDLKPTNISVTGDGTPKLLDFGIAKALEPELDPAHANLTLSHQRLMTPEYASPEQIRDDVITTASDIYALGVVLYELLTGHRPYRFRSRALRDVEEAICEQEPLRPSTAIGRVEHVRGPQGTTVRTLTPEFVSETRDGAPERLRRRLAGDLDAIVLKALRKDPRQRYSSVEQFAADIRNYLDGKPVLARQASMLYQAAKFLRRHRYPILATAAVFASLIIGIAGTSWQAREAARQRDHALAMQDEARAEADNARVEAAKAKRVIVFLKHMLTAANPQRSGPEATVGELLEQVAQRVEVDFGDDPEVESAVRTAIAETYLGLGRYDEAEAQIRAALRIQREIHGGDHFDVAQSLRDLAAILHAKGDGAGAEQASRETLAMQERLHGPDHGDVAQALNDLGAILRARGQLDEAHTLLERALQRRKERLGPDHLLLAETWTNLAGVHLALGNPDAAVAAAQEALRIRRLHLRADHPDLAQAIDNLAVMFASHGRYAEAEPLHREALALYRARLGAQHPDLATTLSSLAGVLYAQGRFSEALEPAREAVEIRRAALPASDPRIAYSEHVLGLCLLKCGAAEAAEEALLGAVARINVHLPPDHPRAQALYRTLVELYNASGRPDRAAEYEARLTTEQSAALPHVRDALG